MANKVIPCGGFEYDDAVFEFDEKTLTLKEQPPAPTPSEILIKSSTPDSTKVFKITVVDAGTISATEVTK